MKKASMLVFKSLAAGRGCRRLDRRCARVIALEDCRLPDVRNRILRLAREDEITEPRTAADVILRLREQVVDLRRERDALLTHNTTLLLEVDAAAKEATRWRNAFERKEEEVRQDAKVTPIRQRPKPGLG